MRVGSGYGVTYAVAPSTYPVTLAEAKLHCRVDSDLTADDSLLSGLIAAATEMAQRHTQRQFVTAQLVMTFDRFPGRIFDHFRGSIEAVNREGYDWGNFVDRSSIRLSRPPVQSVQSIVYLDQSGTLVTLPTSVYELDNTREPARVGLKPSQFWPSTARSLSAVKVNYTAGYGAATAVPQAIKQAILLLVGSWYENREEIAAVEMKPIPRGAEALLDMYCFGEMR